MGNGLLLVKVPADAKIYVNGKATKSTGDERQFISRGLTRGASYNFEVKAEMTRGGEPITITKSAQLTAGGSAELSFDELADEPDQIAETEPVVTKLTVRVPADAKVYLAGTETKQGGEVREFTTTKLSGSNGWTDYTVRAEIQENGKLVSQEQVVSIQPGDTQEISFDFTNRTAELSIAETAQK
jgi:uncharacterized protein (TIGR03000 family)